jgi:hypothetical protein
MKFILASTLCLGAVLLLCRQQVRAQTVPDKPEIADFFPFDTYGKIPPADEKARLDNLAINLLKEPEQVAYIYVYAGRLICAGEVQAHSKRITYHLVNTRGVEAERVFLRDGGYREEATVELWLWPRNGAFGPPSAAPTLDPRGVRVRRICKPISPPRRDRKNSRRQ